MSRTFHFFAALFALSLAVPAVAQTTYPGAAPCNTTLQACIEAAASGDIIEIATNTPIDEEILIERSLTLRPAAGFMPAIGTGLGGTFRHIRVTTDMEDAMTVLVEGLNVDNGQVDISLFNGSGHDVTIQDLTVLNGQDSNNTKGIRADVRSPDSSVLIQRNFVSSNGQAIAVFAQLSDEAASAASFTVLANELTGFEQANSNSGIEVDIRGAGEVTTRLWSNVVYGAAGCNCGGAAGIFIDTLGTVTSNVYVTNNTVDDSQVASDGLSVLARQNSTLNVWVFNNIISNSTRAGVDVGTTDPTATVNVQNNFNSFFANAMANDWNGGSDGPDSGSFDPNYVDSASGDYQPGLISEVIDRGTASPPGGLPPIDATGGPRVVDAGPDMGAIEGAPGSSRPIPAPVLPVSTLSTSGLLFLALLLLAVAARRLF